MSVRKGLLLITMEPPANLQDEFNDWYDTEHFPQRCALPGFETGSRWVCLDGWPRWLALYDLASLDVLDSPAYRAVSGPNSTPWSRRMLPRTIGRMRVAAEQLFPGEARALDPDRVARLLLARYPRTDPERAGDLAAALQDALAASGLLQLRMFASSSGPSNRDLWVIAEFARPVTAAALGDAVGTAADATADLFNIYAAYRRA